MQYMFVCLLALVATGSGTSQFRGTQPTMPIADASPAVVAVPVQDLMGASSVASANLVQAHLPINALQSAMVATASSSHPHVQDVTKLAFGQITDLGSEFHQLRADDQAHTKQLGVDVHLREQLEQDLRQAEAQLEKDNAELAQETTGIAVPENKPVVEVADTKNDATAAGVTVNAEASLVQAKSVSVQQNQMEAKVDKDMKAINGDIGDLRSRDTKEISALRGNSDTRNALSKQIAKQREELDQDTGGLAANLEKIQLLVGGAPSNAAVVAVAAAGDDTPAVANVSTQSEIAQSEIAQPVQQVADENASAE